MSKYKSGIGDIICFRSLNYQLVSYSSKTNCEDEVTLVQVLKKKKGPGYVHIGPEFKRPATVVENEARFVARP